MPTTVRSSLLRNFCARCLTFSVNRTQSPIESVIFPRSNTLKLRAWSSGNCFSTLQNTTMNETMEAQDQGEESKNPRSGILLEEQDEFVIQNIKDVNQFWKH